MFCDGSDVSEMRIHRINYLRRRVRSRIISESQFLPVFMREPMDLAKHSSIGRVPNIMAAPGCHPQLEYQNQNDHISALYSPTSFLETNRKPPPTSNHYLTIQLKLHHPIMSLTLNNWKGHSPRSVLCLDQSERASHLNGIKRCR